MFSLIISIIAIALVAALALASIYYGGSAFNKGTSDADASTIINQAQQIQAAVTMRNINRDSSITTLAGLAPKYLTEIPSFNDEVWSEPDVSVAGYITLGGTLSKDVCDQLNVKAGILIEPAGPEGTYGCFNGDTAYFRTGSFE